MAWSAMLALPLCHGAHCGEGPVLAILAMLAIGRCAWLRVAPLLSSPPLRAMPMQFQAGTGKQAPQPNRKAGQA